MEEQNMCLNEETENSRSPWRSDTSWCILDCVGTLLGDLGFVYMSLSYAEWIELKEIRLVDWEVQQIWEKNKQRGIV